MKALGLQVPCRAFRSASHITRCSPYRLVARHCGDAVHAVNRWLIVGTTSTYTPLNVRSALTVHRRTAESTPCDRTYVTSTGSYSSPRVPCRGWRSSVTRAVDVTSVRFIRPWSKNSNNHITKLKKKHQETWWLTDIWLLLCADATASCQYITSAVLSCYSTKNPGNKACQ